MSKLCINIDDLNKLNHLGIDGKEFFIDTPDVSIDSREINENAIFIAIKGEKFDGHNFIQEAVNKGAKAIVVSDNNIYKGLTNVCKVLVKDTLVALGEIAKFYRRKLKAKVISITGSNGKTSVKDYIAQLLSVKYNVTYTKANNNNHIGVPLTILSADEKTEVLVLEHGTNHFGEIRYTAQIAEPDFGIITNINESHTEFLNNKDGILNEKKELLEVVKQNDGTVILNLDDKKLSEIVKDYPKCITFGFDSRNEYRIIKENNQVAINHGKDKYVIDKKDLDKAFTYNFTAAFAVADKFGLTKDEIKKVENKIKAPKGRLNVIKFQNAIIIDDTYNSNPASLRNGIEFTLNYETNFEKMLILGDMLELGHKSVEMHKAFSEDITKSGISSVLLVGKNMKYLYEASNDNRVLYFNNDNELIGYIKDKDFQNKLIYIKGSRGMRMEQYMEMIMEKLN